MRKIIICSVFVFAAVVGLKAQNKPAAKTTAKTPEKATTTASQPLKTLEDSANYAIGMSIVNFYKQQGVTKINSALIVRSMNDALAGKKLLLDDAQANNAIMTYMNRQQLLKSKPNIDACENFLDENKKKPGVITTASGLQYEVITQGNGPKPAITDTVACNYRGRFLNGNVFDDSYARGIPAEFAVTGVIRGWTEVLQLMTVGSKYKVYVPYQLGYGGSDYRDIPGGSLLIFDVELLSIRGK